MAQSENSENKERGFWESIFGTIGDIIASLLHDFLFDDPREKGLYVSAFQQGLFTG